MKILFLPAFLFISVLAAPPTISLWNLETETGNEPSPFAAGVDTVAEEPPFFRDSSVPAAVKAALRQNHIKMNDTERVLTKIAKMIAGGAKDLIVISDFDHTMSRAYDEKGVKCWATHGVFNEAPIPKLADKMKELKDKYYPIEFNDTLTNEEKTPFMVEWWNQSHEAIIAERITRNILEKLVNYSKIKLRDGAKELMGHLEARHVPLVMFSAGIGDIISIFIKMRLGAVPSNMHLIGNMMIFNDKDEVSGFRDPLIHTFNKNHQVVNRSDVAFIHEMRQRDNVILMGDSMGDTAMDIGVENHSEDRTLKIGFLNKKDELLEKYINDYDIVIVDDQSMDVPRTIIDSITDYRNQKDIY